MSVREQAQIDAIEAEIEDLEASVEACRKTIQVGKALVLAGPALVIAGLWMGGGLLFVAGACCTLGGFVLAGSTDATRRERLARLAELDAERADFIGRIRLTLVPSQSSPTREADRPPHAR